ncbi:unnamed protein product [Orchesella dallaii]|uniref:Uncharacterized protein n=1 Tax=Orchesella dallaii TaxID=48710 RepID=A0ABP1QX93_9HEXA
MGRKRGSKVWGRKKTQQVTVDLSIVKQEPVDHNIFQNDDVGEGKVEDGQTPVSRKSSRIQERVRKSNETVLKSSQEVGKPKLVTPPSIKLQVLDFKVEQDSDHSDDLTFDFDTATPLETPDQIKPPSIHLKTNNQGSSSSCAGDVIVPLSNTDFENMPHQEALILLRKYMSNYVLDKEHIKALSESNAQQTRSVGKLIEENDKLKKSALDSKVMSEAERMRAEDAWKKLETTKLYNKATEEGELQRHFLRNKYESAINEIKSGCDKRLKELEKDRSMLARENSTHVNNMLRMKKSYSKMKNKVDQLQSIVRMFSSALDLVVDFSDIKHKLSCFGTPFLKRYNEALLNKPSIKELNFAKRIANVSRLSPISPLKSNQIPDTSDSDSIDEFLDVITDKPYAFTHSTLLDLNSELLADLNDEDKSGIHDNQSSLRIKSELVSPTTGMDESGTFIQDKTSSLTIKSEMVSPTTGMEESETFIQEKPSSANIKSEMVSPIPAEVDESETTVEEKSSSLSIKSEMISPISEVDESNAMIQEKTGSVNNKSELASPTTEMDDSHTKIQEKGSSIKSELVSPTTGMYESDTIVQEKASSLNMRSERVSATSEVDEPDPLIPEKPNSVKIKSEMVSPTTEVDKTNSFQEKTSSMKSELVSVTKEVDESNTLQISEMVISNPTMDETLNTDESGFRAIKEEKGSPPDSPPMSPPLDDDMPESIFPDDDEVHSPPTVEDVALEYSLFTPVSPMKPPISSIFDPETPFEYVKKERITPPVASMPDLFVAPSKEWITPSEQDEANVKIPIVSTKPKMWGKRLVSYNPEWEVVNQPQRKQVTRNQRLPFLPPDYMLSHNFKLVSPIVTPPSRPLLTHTNVTQNQSNLVIEFPIQHHQTTISTQDTQLPPKTGPVPISVKSSDQINNTLVIPAHTRMEHVDTQRPRVEGLSSEIGQPSLPKTSVQDVIVGETEKKCEIKEGKRKVEESVVVIPSKKSAFQWIGAQVPNQESERVFEKAFKDQGDVQNTKMLASERRKDVGSVPNKKESNLMSKLFGLDEDDGDKEVDEEADEDPENASYDVIKLIEDESNPFITKWDSDRDERVTPPIVLLSTRHKPHKPFLDKNHPPPPNKNAKQSLRSRLNDGISTIKPVNSGVLGCNKLRLETQIREAKKRAQDSSSSDECTVKKKKKQIVTKKYSMTDLFGDDNFKSQVDEILSDEYAQADNESNDCTEEEDDTLINDLIISDDDDDVDDDGIQPPASPDPEAFTPDVQSHFQVDQDLVKYLKELFDLDVDKLLCMPTSRLEVEENVLSVGLYKAIVETQEHEYLAHVTVDERVSRCPLIPRFQNILTLLNKLERRRIISFLDFFINHVIPNDSERLIENDQFLVNMGRLMGAITLFLDSRSHGLDMLFNFLLYRPPFAYSFAHGLLCSDSSVIGYTGFSQFDDLCKKTQAILFSIFNHPRFGDARYAKPVIEMIKRSLNINVPDITFDQFLWKTVEHTFTIESDRELNRCSHVIAMLVIQKGLPFFDTTYINRFSDWIRKWSLNDISDGVIAALINTVGIIADALRRTDIPESTTKLQGILKAIGNVGNAPKLIKDVANSCVTKLEQVVLKGQKEDWYYEKKNSGVRRSQNTQGSNKKKKYKKLRVDKKDSPGGFKTFRNVETGLGGGFKKFRSNRKVGDSPGGLKTFRVGKKVGESRAFSKRDTKKVGDSGRSFTAAAYTKKVHHSAGGFSKFRDVQKVEDPAGAFNKFRDVDKVDESGFSAFRDVKKVDDSSGVFKMIGSTWVRGNNDKDKSYRQQWRKEWK